eukprot:COSAG05_NODE_14961_length_382_cov_0.724382_1_plen_126_part_11
MTEVDQSPQPNQTPAYMAFFLIFHVVFSFFLLNLFIGVLNSSFASQSGSNLVTHLQRKWIRALAMFRTYSPINTDVDKPDVGVRCWKQRQLLWILAKNPKLEVLWTAGVVVNVLVISLLPLYTQME